jgi:hypothetical protein
VFEQIIDLFRNQFAQYFARAVLIFALIGSVVQLFSDNAAAFPHKGPMDVGVFPYYGIATLRSPAIDKMNARLGNSPRLGQPLGFGNQDLYGGNLQVWTNRRKSAFGLGIWSSQASLRGRSDFEGVAGAATLSLIGVEGIFNYRLIPAKSPPPLLRRKWHQNFNVYLGLVTGFSQVNFKSAITDDEQNVNMNYIYSGDRLLAGSRILVTWEPYTWLSIIIADINFRQLIPISSSVSVRSYIISGREESALASESLKKEFDKAILMGTTAVGLEILL